MKYTKTIFFYLDDEELNDLDEEADMAGITRSQYVRRCINETVMKPMVKINYSELITVFYYTICTINVISSKHQKRG